MNKSESLSINVSEWILQNDLALLSNADGNWDDFDDDELNYLHTNVSAPTLTSMTSSSATKIDEPQDAWDLEQWNLCFAHIYSAPFSEDRKHRFAAS